jgi:hypothetical protein
VATDTMDKEKNNNSRRNTCILMSSW